MEDHGRDEQLDTPLKHGHGRAKASTCGVDIEGGGKALHALSLRLHLLGDTCAKQNSPQKVAHLGLLHAQIQQPLHAEHGCHEKTDHHAPKITQQMHFILAQGIRARLIRAQGYCLTMHASLAQVLPAHRRGPRDLILAKKQEATHHEQPC